MSIYEITFITREDKTAEIAKMIEASQGKIIAKKSLGRRKLAYPIKKEIAGFYSTLVFSIDEKELTELDKDLRIKPDILRFLLISYQKEFSPRALVQRMLELKKPLVSEVKKEAEEKEVEEVIIQKKEVKARPVAEKPIEEAKVKVEPEKEKDKGKEVLAKKEEKEKEKTEIKRKEPKFILPEVKKEAVSEEERLAKLEEKLEELLKD